jgi:hypothetical protein
MPMDKAKKESESLKHKISLENHTKRYAKGRTL